MRIYDKLMFTLGLLTAAGCSTSSSSMDQASGRTATIKQGVTLRDRIAACQADPRVATGVLDLDTCVGGDLFLRETFDGNGRSCATCHPVDHSFTIDPDFIATLPGSNPLFVAETQDALAQLEVPDKMRRFGVILENVDGFAPDPTTHFVLRSVPHTLSLATSITNPYGSPDVPANRVGWSGDGAPNSGALRDFMTGAIRQHYTRSLGRIVDEDFRFADDDELDRIDHFLRQLGRLNELDLANVVLEDAGAEVGRQQFLTVGCNKCHGNAGANASVGVPGNRNFDIGVELARTPELADFPQDGGFGTAPNPEGSFGDHTFNTPPLIEAASTGPFFHVPTSVTGAEAHNTDVARSIEEAVAFYDSDAFRRSPARATVRDMTPADIDNIGRFLRVINAGFNTALARKRLEALAVVLASYGNSFFDIQRELLRLAQVDVDNALRVLGEVSIGGASTDALNRFTALTPDVLDNCSVEFRTQQIEHLRRLLATASRRFGTNLTYQIGDSVVMF